MNDYALFKSLHLLGAIVFVGNIIVTAWWKAAADRTGDARVVAFAQRQVTLTDFVFTAVGVILLLVGGYAMALRGPWDLGLAWLGWGQVLFFATGLVWVAGLIPIQCLQARMARGFARGGPIPARYRRLSTYWMGLGSLAVVMPLAAFFLMLFKPI